MELDVHLMITSPSRYALQFAKSGANIVVFHVEAETPENIRATLRNIRNLGARAGLSVKPGTPAEALSPYIDTLDIVLVMTVEPGFGGQKFIGAMLPKISELRRVIENRNNKCELEVDGGINLETAKLCINAGANVLVAGSDIFGEPDRAARIAALRAVGG
jgi:ribulose-phosphate 3-epimerase